MINKIKKLKLPLIIGSVLIVICLIAIYVPKLFIADIAEVRDLESLYAKQQARIFFDNPIERLIIMNTAIVGMDEENYQVSAYTFFGLKYRMTDIERISEYEMRLLLSPALQKKQYEAQSGAREILSRSKHPWMPCIRYSDLIADGNFSPKKIHGMVPDIDDTNSLFFKADYKDYEVYLLLYLEDVYTNSMKRNFNFENTGIKSEYIYNTKDIKISKAHHVAVLDSYMVEYKGFLYDIIFDVLSNQEAPADIDHIWDPDHNIRQDDIKYILKSMLGDVLENNYFDKDLKLSFTYPDYFYIETENLGPNFDILITPFPPDDPDWKNPEGFIYTSLRMKKVLKGEEYEALLDYFHEKAEDKGLYPNYEERDMEIKGNKIKLIKFVSGFSGGMDVNYLLDAGDYILHVSFYNDTLYADEYGEITESIVIQ